jgi:hypothetical protein
MKLKTLYRLTLIITAACLALASALTASAAEFSAVTEIYTPDLQLKGNFYIKGDWIRQERNMSKGMNLVLIANLKTYQAYVLLPMAKMYTKLNVPKNALPQGGLPWQGEKNLPPGARKVGAEKLYGYKCNVYAYQDKKHGFKGKAWISTRLDFPVQVQGASNRGSFNLMLKDIKPGGVSSKLMRPPSDFREMKVPPELLGTMLGLGN